MSTRLAPRVLAALAAGLMFIGLLLSPAQASPWRDDPGRPLLQLARNEGVSLEEAVAQVRRKTGGRILSAETRSRNGVTVHRIKVLTGDQRVRIIEVDARTGEWR